MRILFLCIASFYGLSGCHVVKEHENWRDRCQRYYTTDKGQYIKCMRAKKQREEPTKQRQPGISLKPLDLPRTQKDYGRIRND